MTDDDVIRIAVPKPDSDGAHAIETPVAAVHETIADCPDARAVVACEEGAIVLTAAQAQSVAADLETVAEALETHHGVSGDD